jgi:hypothetical protein
MNKISISVKPEECKGCLICQLICSLAYTGAFNPEKASILIEPLKEISFTNECVENRIGDSLPPCQAACPLHVDVKGYTTLISQGRFEDALRLIRENLPFPGVMARVCTHPCENKCKRAEVDEAIAINALKRCAADYAELEWEQGIDEEREERIAIIGSGPARLMAAYDLRNKSKLLCFYFVLFVQNEYSAVLGVYPYPLATLDYLRALHGTHNGGDSIFSADDGCMAQGSPSVGVVNQRNGTLFEPNTFA